MTNASRPVLKVPTDVTEKLLETIAIASVVVTFLYLQMYYKDLPDLIPMHLSFDGRVTRLDAKSNLYVVPFLSLGLYLLLTFFSRRPEKFNYLVAITEANAHFQYRNARRMLAVFKAVLCLFICISMILVLRNPGEVGSEVPYVGVGILGLLVLVFGLSVYFVGKSFRRP